MALFKILRGNAANLPKDKKDGYAYFCTDTHDFYIDYTDNSGQLTRGQLNAYAADKLTTGRNISLDTAVSSTATTFDGSKNITIPITGVKEAYLTWGGKSWSGSISPLGAALSEKFSANKLAYAKPAGFKFETSSNSGSTWVDETTKISNEIITHLFTGTSSANIKLGPSGTNTASLTSQARITLEAKKLGLYISPSKLLMNVNTTGHTCFCKIETKTNASGATWQRFNNTDYQISGWSGWNDLPLVLGTFGGGDTQTSNIHHIRLTFYLTKLDTNYTSVPSLLNLVLFAKNDWGTASTLASRGHLYSYDWEQNATFPKKVTATTLTSTGDTIVDGALSVTGTSTLTGAVTSGALTASSLKSNGALTVTGNSTLSGSLTVKGNTTLGDAATDTVTIKGPITAENNLTVKGSVTLGDNYSVDRIALNGYTLMSGNIEVLNNSYFYIGQKNDEDWFYVDNSTTSPYVEVYGMPLVINGAGGISIDTGDLFVGGFSYLNNAEVAGYLDVVGSDSGIYLYDDDGFTRAEITNIFKNTGGFQVKDMDKNIMHSALTKTQLLIRKIEEDGTASIMVRAKNDGTLTAATSVTSPNFIGALTGNADTATTAENAEQAETITWYRFDASGIIS